MKYEEPQTNWKRNIPHIIAIAGAGIVIYSVVAPKIFQEITINLAALNQIALYSGFGLLALASMSFAFTQYYDNEYQDILKHVHLANSESKQTYKTWKAAEYRTKNALYCALLAPTIFIGSGVTLAATQLITDVAMPYTTQLLNNIPDISPQTSQLLSKALLSTASTLIIAILASGLIYLCSTSSDSRHKSNDKNNPFRSFEAIMTASGAITMGSLITTFMPEIMVDTFGLNPLSNLQMLVLCTVILNPFFAIATSYLQRQALIILSDLNYNKGFHPLMTFSEEEFHLLMGASALTMYRDQPTESNLRAQGYNKIYAVFEEGGTHAMVFYNADKKSAIVAFRPTLSPSELLVDAKFMPTKPDFGENMLVHGGILQAMYNLRKNIDGVLEHLSGNDCRGIQLFTVGHSLGSGLATFYGMSYQERYYNRSADGSGLNKPYKRVRTLVSGAPKVIYRNPEVPIDEVKVPNINITRFGQKVDPVDRIAFGWAGADEVGQAVEGPQMLNPLNLVHAPGIYQKAGQEVYSSNRLSFDANPLSHSIVSLLGHLVGNPIPFLNTIVRKLFSPFIVKGFSKIAPDVVENGNTDAAKVEVVELKPGDPFEDISVGKYNRDGTDSIKVQKALMWVSPTLANFVMHHLFGHSPSK